MKKKYVCTITMQCKTTNVFHLNSQYQKCLKFFSAAIKITTYLHATD
jgi:hypothetical protein